VPYLVVLGLIGLCAQLIDGALGMAYGATSATLLLSTGATPAVASATVHLAEVGTTFVSGVSHWRFGNVNWRLVVPLALPGAAAGFVGAVVLTSIPGDVAKPYVAGFLLLLGLYVLVRFASRRSGNSRRRERKPLSRPLLLPLGATAGFLDAVGGGGWGPLTTTTLVASERVEPRKAIGSVDTAEFLVSLAASVGFLLGLGQEAVNWAWACALLAGGVVAAPIAAWLVRSLDTRVLGVGVGSVLMVTNGDTLLGELGIRVDGAMPYVYAALGATMTVAAVPMIRRRLRTAPA
jgi:uncharacterized protein